MADWELDAALQSAKEDREWEKEESQTGELKSGEIGVSIKYQGGKPLLNFKGIGKSTKAAIKKQIKKVSKDDSSSEGSGDAKSAGKVKIYSTPPAIASKSVSPEDLFNVSEPIHNILESFIFGFISKVNLVCL